MEKQPVIFGAGLAANLLPYDGQAELYSHFLTPEENDHYLFRLEREIDWKQESIRLFGKAVMQPRLTAWYGEEGSTYRYSGLTMHPLPWTAALIVLKQRAEQVCGTYFNSALLNYYRDGKDSMGWHRDNEKELGPQPLIASLSLGAPRLFRFRHYMQRQESVSLVLSPGSLLVMGGDTQTHWQHALPKSSKPLPPRINITFRTIVS